jgi:hypothetical protein
MLTAIASDRPFYGRKRRVMYIDGDMPAETLQERASGWQTNYTDPQGLIMTHGRGHVA